ncbi:hypothetical protein N9D23_08600 [Rubripirellula sp.]|nr:hypothetical protein [Rubripirellula sp.]
MIEPTARSTYLVFYFSAAAPLQVLLEVAMRQQQIIANVARVVSTTIREMEAVVLFARTGTLHLWQKRMSMGSPGYQLSIASLPLRGKPAMNHQGNPGSQRGNWSTDPKSAPASCSRETDLA